MKFKHLLASSIALVFMGACGQGTNNNQDQKENDTELKEGTQEQPEAAPRDQTTNPNANQMPPQGGAPNTSSADVSDEQLMKFVKINQEMQVINQSAQQEMMKAVQDQGMKVERYTQIQQSIQDPNSETDASQEEMKQFEAVNVEIEKLQTSVQQQMQGIMEDNEVTEAEMQELATQIQSDQNLMQRFQSMQQQNSGGGMSQ